MGPMPAHLKKQLEAQGTNLKKKGDKDDDTLFLTVLIIFKKIFSLYFSKGFLVPSVSVPDSLLHWLP